MKKMAHYLHDSAIPAKKEPSQPGKPAPTTKILLAKYFHRDEGYHINRPTGTRDWLLTYTVSGEGLFRHNDDCYACRHGDVMLLAPGNPHDFRTGEGSTWEFAWVHFVPPLEWKRSLNLLNRDVSFISIASEEDRNSILTAFQELIHYCACDGILHEELAFNSLKKILLLMARSAQWKHHALDPRIEKILALFSRQLGEPYDVAQLARIVSLSPSRLAHLFKEQMGESIMETLLKIRMREAGKLLEYTTLPVHEIACEVGIPSPYYFTRRFTAFYGMNPTRYRQLKNGNSLP